MINSILGVASAAPKITWLTTFLILSWTWKAFSNQIFSSQKKLKNNRILTYLKRTISNHIFLLSIPLGYSKQPKLPSYIKVRIFKFKKLKNAFFNCWRDFFRTLTWEVLVPKASLNNFPLYSLHMKVLKCHTEAFPLFLSEVFHNSLFR